MQEGSEICKRVIKTVLFFTSALKFCPKLILKLTAIANKKGKVVVGQGKIRDYWTSERVENCLSI